MTHSYDKILWDEGILYLAGIDEVGRGPLAGPVVAAVVVLDPTRKIYKLNDSKKLSEKVRLNLAPRIKEKSKFWAIAEASVEEINKLNILNATFLAMKRALDGLPEAPDFFLVDGRDLPTFLYREQSVPLRGRALIKGDSLSVSIASASILAKVYRDNLMKEMALEYPGYGFEEHKGYASKYHIDRIKKLGPCSIHRSKFISKIRTSKSEQLSLI